MGGGHRVRLLYKSEYRVFSATLLARNFLRAFHAHPCLTDVILQAPPTHNEAPRRASLCHLQPLVARCHPSLRAHSSGQL